MAEKIKIPCGWFVYKLNKNELLKFQAVHCLGNVCDLCNEHLSEMYYIPVLNYGMCESCYMNWSMTAKYYPDDQNFEQQNIEWFESWKRYLHSFLDT